MGSQPARGTLRALGRTQLQQRGGVDPSTVQSQAQPLELPPSGGPPPPPSGGPAQPAAVTASTASSNQQVLPSQPVAVSGNNSRNNSCNTSPVPSLGASSRDTSSSDTTNGAQGQDPWTFNSNMTALGQIMLQKKLHPPLCRRISDPRTIEQQMGHPYQVTQLTSIKRTGSFCNIWSVNGRHNTQWMWHVHSTSQP